MGDYMAVRRPSLDEMRSVARDLSLSMSDADLNEFIAAMSGSLDAYDLVDGLPDELPPVRHARSAAYHPTAQENPLNAWAVKSRIVGAPNGKLSGKTVAIKDNIAVAHLPMINGSSVLNGYVPDIDATVVARLLDAGATILGKSHCEYYCMSGGSHTGAHGPVRNPHNPDHSAGGSSSGNAALLAAGEIDLAVGGDQGGSIRTPGAYCGVVGLKPTFGLVPYTGAMPIELTIDHLGPMSRTVADNALMLEVLAGPDGLDPRQSALGESRPYTEALHKSVSGLRVGVVREGFGLHNSEADVDASVRSSAELFARLGAVVEDVSIPMHTIGKSIWTVLATEGATNQMMKGNGFGFNWKGLYLTSLIEALSAWRQRADALADTVKFTMLLGEYTIRTGHGRHYAKAQNLSRKLAAAYDEALARYDLLLMPTTPLKAPPLPPADAPRSLVFQRAWENMHNTFPFDLTGHPCLQVPCGMSSGLPIGMMLVGKHFDEMTLYRAAHAFEQSGDWKVRLAA
jgi:amidase